MEDFASGVLVGVVLLVTVFGLIKFGLWCGKTENRIAMIEAQFKALIGSFRVKGKQNENTDVAGQKPAGPEKTS